MNYYLECFCQMIDYYRGFSRIRNHFFRYSLFFSNNSLLFYSVFYMKIEICFLYKGASYSWEPAVSHLVDRYTYPLPQCFINYLMWSTSRRSPLKESVGSLTLFRSHLSSFCPLWVAFLSNFFPVEVQFLKFTPVPNQVHFICLL